MRAHEFLFLNETGLAHAQITKDYGNYLDQLINFIANGDEVELEGPSVKRFGTSVTFEKSEAIKLTKAYYGQDTIPDDKTNLEVTASVILLFPSATIKI